MERQKIESSSNIVSAGFENGVMEIEFEAGRDAPKVYRYTDAEGTSRGLTEQLYKGLMTAESKGRFFAANIRHNKGVVCAKAGDACGNYGDLITRKGDDAITVYGICGGCGKLKVDHAPEAIRGPA